MEQAVLGAFVLYTINSADADRRNRIGEDHVCCDGASADFCAVPADGIGEKDTGKRQPAKN